MRLGRRRRSNGSVGADCQRTGLHLDTAETSDRAIDGGCAPLRVVNRVVLRRRNSAVHRQCDRSIPGVAVAGNRSLFASHRDSAVDRHRLCFATEVGDAVAVVGFNADILTEREACHSRVTTNLDDRVAGLECRGRRRTKNRRRTDSTSASDLECARRHEERAAVSRRDVVAVEVERHRLVDRHSRGESEIGEKLQCRPLLRNASERLGKCRIVGRANQRNCRNQRCHIGRRNRRHYRTRSRLKCLNACAGKDICTRCNPRYCHRIANCGCIGTVTVVGSPRDRSYCRAGDFRQRKSYFVRSLGELRRVGGIVCHRSHFRRPPSEGVDPRCCSRLHRIFLDWGCTILKCLGGFSTLDHPSDGIGIDCSRVGCCVGAGSGRRFNRRSPAVKRIGVLRSSRLGWSLAAINRHFACLNALSIKFSAIFIHESNHPTRHNTECASAVINRDKAICREVGVFSLCLVGLRIKADECAALDVKVGIAFLIGRVDAVEREVIAIRSLKWSQCECTTVDYHRTKLRLYNRTAAVIDTAIDC